MADPMPMMDAEATTIPIDDMPGEGDMASTPTNRLWVVVSANANIAPRPAPVSR